MSKIIKIFRQAVHQFLHHDGLVSSGHLAFLTLLGLFPFIIFIISLAALAGQTQRGIQIIDFFLSQLPSDVQSVLQIPVNNLLQDTDRGILITSITGAIWISSSTVNAARVAIRRAYNLPGTPAYWRHQLESVALVILSGIALVAGMTILVLGPAIATAINALISFSGSGFIFSEFSSILVGLAFIFPALCCAYFVLGPSGHRRRIAILPGAVTALILWIVVGAAFSTYLKYFGQYSNTYGNLAGPIIALIFFYTINAAFLFGAEVNSAASKPLPAHVIPPAKEV